MGHAPSCTKRTEVEVRGASYGGSVRDWSKAHKAAAEQKKHPNGRKLRPQLGGFSTKLHAVVDALGNCLHLVLTPGQQADSPQLPGLLAALARPPGAVVADQATILITYWLLLPSAAPRPSFRPSPTGSLNATMTRIGTLTATKSSASSGGAKKREALPSAMIRQLLLL